MRRPGLFQCELWRPVPGFEGYYEVSCHGRIKSFLPPNGKGVCRLPRILGPGRPGCYREFLIRRPGARWRTRIHVLVARLFIEVPMGRGPDVEPNHLDGNKANNHADNLEWISRSGNIQHSYDLGLSRSGERHPSAKLTEAQVRRIRELRSQGFTQTQRAAQFGVAQSQISFIEHRHSWRRIT